MKISRRTITRAMRGTEKPSEDSEYAKKKKRRVRLAHKLGMPADTPWPILKLEAINQGMLSSI